MIAKMYNLFLKMILANLPHIDSFNKNQGGEVKKYLGETEKTESSQVLIALYLYVLKTHDVELFTVILCYDGTFVWTR